MKNFKKYIPLINVLVIAGLGFAYRGSISRRSWNTYVDNKVFTKQLEKLKNLERLTFSAVGRQRLAGRKRDPPYFKGDITVQLFPTLAPKASENFLACQGLK